MATVVGVTQEDVEEGGMVDFKITGLVLFRLVFSPSYGFVTWQPN